MDPRPQNRLVQLLPLCGGSGLFVALATVDSFLLDPFLLFANGFLWAFLWERLWKPSGRAWALPVTLCSLTVACYWVVSTSLYFNLAWIDFLAKGCGAENGRDWMLNSGVFHFDFKTPGLATHVVAGLFLLTYPAWMTLGAWAGARIGRGSPDAARTAS